jgi:hypothetical protein
VIRVERRFAEQLVVVGEDAHVVVDHVQDDRLANVLASHVDVHQSRVVPNGDLATSIDDVATHAVAMRVPEPCGTGFFALAIGDEWRLAAPSAVWAHFVVVLDELIKVPLQLGERRRGVLVEPLLQGAMPTFDLALGLGMVGT